MKALMALGLTGFGLGAGARALTGMRSLLSTKGPSVPMTSSVPTSIPIPAYMPPAGEEEGEPNLKVANAVLDHPLYSWWGIPAAAATATAGVGGGWGLVNWLLDKRKKARMQQQLADAKEEFNTAIRDQYATAMQSKAASDENNPIPELDELYDLLMARGVALEKQADEQGWYQWAKDSIPGVYALDRTAQGAAGAYLTALLGVGALGGLGAYKWTKNRNKEKVLRRAMEMRARQRMAPQPVYALPVPTPLSA